MTRAGKIAFGLLGQRFSQQLNSSVGGGLLDSAHSKQANRLYLEHAAIVLVVMFSTSDDAAKCV